MVTALGATAAFRAVPSLHTKELERCPLNRKPKPETVRCEYFTWRLRLRENGVWYADGRGNDPNPGRHSLDEREYDMAIANLQKLDILEAIRLGKADASILSTKGRKPLLLEEGRHAYFTHVGRPRITGGVTPTTKKRYRPVFDKFLAWLQGQGVGAWNSVKRHHLESYAAFLDGEGYAYATEFFELTTIKQAIKVMIQRELLPAECQIHLPLPKPSGTDTYCYREVEVEAMLSLCGSDRKLRWLHDVLAMLAFTGMRISELTSLRRSNIDLESNSITLVDERYSRLAAKGQARTTKGKRNRTFPILPNLRPILEPLVQAQPTGPLLLSPSGSGLRADHVRICLKRDVLAPLVDRFPSDESEIGFKDGRLHSFRHFFCSLCANSDVGEPVLMNWLGHRDSKMVRHYYHLHNEEAQRQIAKVNVSWWPSVRITSEET